MSCAHDNSSRWIVFCAGVLPLAVFVGIFAVIIGYCDPRPGAWHPVLSGLALGGVFAGVLGAAVWARGSRARMHVLLFTLFGYTWLSFGWHPLHYAALGVWLFDIIRLFLRREQSTSNE